MKIFKKISLVFAIVLLMVSSLSFINLKTVKAADNSNPQYVVGTTKNVSSAIALMGKNLRGYTSNNVNVDVKTYNSTAELNAAIKEGTVNAAVTDLVNYAGISKDAKDWKLAGTMPGYNALVANKKYKNVKKLKGQTIAVDKSDYSKFYLTKVLKKNKMKLSDVKLQQVDAEADRVSSLKDGKIAAAVLSDPSISEAKVNGDKVIAKDKISGTNGNVLIINNKFAKKNGSATQILCYVINDEIKTINKSNTYSLTNNSFSEYGVGSGAIKKLNDMEVKFNKMHKVKKSCYNAAFKYAKKQKLYSGQISIKGHQMKIKGVK